jgi:hypothetical protein
VARKLSRFGERLKEAMMQRNAEISEQLSQMYAVFNTGDVSIVDRFLSREEGVLGIGTDPREWWAGTDLRDAFNTQPVEMHSAGLRFEPGDIQAFSEGTVGWFADRPVLKMPDAGEVPMRLSGVFRQEDGVWKMVQFHLSIGAMNEESIGENLTI